MAGYIGTQAVSVNTTSATISDDLTVGDDATIAGDLDVDGTTNLDVVDIDGAVNMATTALVTGVLTSNGGAVFNEGSADVDFRVESNGQANMLFVDGGANAVGINTAVQVDGSSVMNHPLTIAAASGGNLFAMNRGTGGLFSSFMGTTGTVGIAATGSDGRLEFRTGTTVGTSSIRMTVESAGDVTIENGNLVVGTAGKGIDFSAQTATSASGSQANEEILNHYEQGSFTPNFIDNSGRGAAAMSVATGFYTRIGAMVHIHGYVVVNGLGSMNGLVIMTGLPFAAVNLTNGFGAISITQSQGLAITAGSNLGMRTSPASPNMSIAVFDSTTGTTDITHTELSADGGFIYGGSYHAV